MIGVDSEQYLVKSLFLAINWLSYEIIDSFVKVRVLTYFDQEIFTVYLINVFRAFFLWLHETTSKVVNPLAGKVNINFLLDVLKSIFLNHRKNTLHSLLSLFLLLVFDKLTIELNFCVLRADSFSNYFESWRFE